MVQAGDEATVPVAEGFRGPQVCAIVGITYRQLDYWARTDLLRPSLQEARGSGSQRYYSYTDLVQLKVIKRLLDGGLSLRSARRAIDCLRQTGGDLASANLVLEGSSTVLARSDEEVIDLLKGGQGVLVNVMPLAALVSEVDAAIGHLHADTPDASAPDDAPSDQGEPARAERRASGH